MKNGTFVDRAAVALVLLATLDGCQLVKKLTGRGESDAGATTRTTPTPILGDAGGASPVIALPNPTVSPLPSQTPTPTAAADAAVPALPTPAADAAVAVEADAGAAPTVAVVDAGAVPAMDSRMRRRFHNFCKEHPGQVHPLTHVLCPM